MNRLATQKHRLAIATVAMALTTQLAIAQNTDNTEDQQELKVETITVTARKVAENIQDTPLAITAFGEAEIAEAGIANIEDVALLTPGLSFAPLFGGVGSVPVIRGQSTSIGEPNVGFFVDGVYQSSRATMNALLAGNIERIEVAKGPQSALYGRNTFAGAINYITKRPSNDTELDVQATLGSYALTEFRGSASGALIDDMLFVRAAASHHSRDGYFDNRLSGGDLDDRKTNTFSLSMQADPVENLSAVLRFGYEKTADGDEPLQFIANNAVPANPTPVPLPPALQLFVGEVPVVDSGFAVTPGKFDRKNVNLSLSLDYELGSGTTLTSITGYNDLSFERHADNDYSPRSLRYLQQKTDQNEFSQELRLASSNQSVHWMAGVYYYDLDADSSTRDVFVDTAFALAGSLVGSPLAGLLPAGSISANTEKTQSLAVFGSLSFHINDDVTATLEGRYTREEKDINAREQNPINMASATFTESAKFSNVVPKLTVDYQFDNDTLLYVSAAKAIKTGGFNIDVTGSGILNSERVYDPEESWTYEAGVKADLLDGRARVNGALYRINWKDQIVRALGATFATLNANAGETSIDGLELEAQIKLNANLDLSAGYAYTDSAYDQYTFGALAGLGVNPVLNGTQLQWVAKNQFNVTVQYVQPVFDDWEWITRLDYAYASKQSIVQTADAYVPGAGLFNLRFIFENDSMSVAVWAKNLLDEDAPVTGAFIPNQGSRFDTAVSLVSPAPVVGFQAFNALILAREPRTLGVTFRKRF